MASQDFCMGQGVQKTLGGSITAILKVTGYDFNPSNVKFDAASYDSFSIWQEGYNRNLFLFYPGHEVQLSMTTVHGPFGGGTVSHQWKHPDGTVYFTFNYSMPAFEAGWWWLMYSYSGLRPASLGSMAEIYINGTYSVVSTVPGTINLSKNFIVTGIISSRMTLYMGSQGHLWVEGDTLAFIPWIGTKNFIKNDGGDYGSPVATRGRIWIPNISGENKIYYIDESGVLRHTHKADSVGYYGNDGVGTGGHTPGYIWAQQWFNWTYLMFIDYNGIQCRISNGNILA